MGRVLLNIVIISASLSAARASYPGNHSCPCLNKGFGGVLSPSNGTDCVDVTRNDGETYCHPPDYGKNCSAWDENLQPYCDSSDDGPLPTFCTTSWCYVDADTCFDSYFLYAQTAFSSDLFYSYSTCGNEDTWTQEIFSKELEGTTLRVGVPALYYPDHYKLTSNGSIIYWNLNIYAGEGDFTGIYIDYIEKIADAGGFELEYLPVSTGGIVDAGWDSWSGCINDLSRGLLDICIGNFWETAARRSVATFTTPILDDEFYLLVPKLTVDSSFFSQDQLGKVFGPFENNLWYALTLITFGMGFFHATMGREGVSNVKSARNTCLSVEDSILEILSGSVEKESNNLAQRVLAITWAFLIMVALASYTANLAAILSHTAKVHAYSNIEDCISKNCRVCYPSQSVVLKTRIEELYPKLHNYKQMSYADMAEALKDGDCEAAMVSALDWSLNVDYWGDCDGEFVGNNVLSFNTGFPVSSDVNPAISHLALHDLHYQGFTETLRPYVPSQSCDPSAAKSDDSDEADLQLKIGSFATPFLLVFSAMLFAIGCKVIEVARRGSAKEGEMSELKHEEEVPGKPPLPHNIQVLLKKSMEDIARCCLSELGSSQATRDPASEDYEYDVEI